VHSSIFSDIRFSFPSFLRYRFSVQSCLLVHTEQFGTCWLLWCIRPWPTVGLDGIMKFQTPTMWHGTSPLAIGLTGTGATTLGKMIWMPNGPGTGTRRRMDLDMLRTSLEWHSHSEVHRLCQHELQWCKNTLAHHTPNGPTVVCVSVCVCVSVRLCVCLSVCVCVCASNVVVCAFGFEIEVYVFYSGRRFSRAALRSASALVGRRMGLPAWWKRREMFQNLLSVEVQPVYICPYL